MKCPITCYTGDGWELTHCYVEFYGRDAGEKIEPWKNEPDHRTEVISQSVSFGPNVHVQLAVGLVWRKQLPPSDESSLSSTEPERS